MSRRVTGAYGGRRAVLLGGAAAAAVGLIITAIFDPRAAAAGWLTAFVLCSQIPVGCLMLIMIHRLTGGRWGEAIEPVTVPAARAVWLLALAVIPVLVAVPTLYGWSQGGAGTKPDVLAYYLNVPFFVGRSVVAIAGWIVLAILVPRIRGAAAPPIAAAGLIFHCVLVSLVSVDWVLSLEPPFVSSSFGASMAITQLIAATAWAALRAPQREGEPVTGDLGGLLLAFVLAITYVDFMAFLVMWYSDLPHRLFWFVERDRWPWSLLAGGAFVLASVGPVLALLLSRVRNRAAPLRAVSASVLAGLACCYGYLILPPFGAFALVPAVLAVIVVGLAFAAVASGPDHDLLPARRSLHGA
jgi:hypothetical protein